MALAPASSPWPARIAVAGAVLGGVAAALLAGALSGALRPSLLADSGPLVRWGLPVVGTVTNLAIAVTVGSLVLTCVAFPVTRPSPKHPVATAFEPGLRLASVAAGLWALGEVVLAVLQYADVSGLPMDDPAFGSGLASFLRDIEFGRLISFSAVIAATVALGAAGAVSITAAGLLCLLALGGLIPPALAGHSAALTGHETAVTSLGLHLLGISVWIGGLLTLVLVAGPLRSGAGRGGHGALPTAVRRFSGLAGWCLVLVLVSGVLNASLRVTALDQLWTGYGLILVAKTLAIAALALLGLRQRRAVVPRLGSHGEGPAARAAFLRYAATEVVLMGVTVGLAAALSRTPPPADTSISYVGRAEAITGYAMPPAPTVVRWLTSWQPDVLWLTIGLLMLVLYLGGVRRLAVRGDRWPAHRVALWTVGVALLVWITSGGPIVYGRVSFSAHMIGHMSLSMVVPLFLVFGAPVTLALRALRPRQDGTRGPREWLLGALESRFVRIVSHPLTAAFLFAFSLVFFYYSGLFGLALTTHTGHELMHLHFLVAGYLFANALVGIDPGPQRPAYPMRLLLLLATMGFHAFFGVALLQGSAVLQETFFASLERPWSPDLLADQRLGGGIAWGLGEIPTLALAMILAVQWSRSDDREARRRDRAADRDGDAELAAYNRMLARLAGQSDPG